MMSRSLFGGDPTMSHFTVSLPLKAYPLRSKERKLAYRQLKEASGGREQYFQYKTKDEKAKAIAKKHCENLAEHITKQTGLTLEVAEGCFL